jgi:rod shape-determining protein MreC
MRGGDMRGFLQQYRVVLSCVFFLILSLFLASANTRTPYSVDPVGVILLEIMHPLQLGTTLTVRSVKRLWERYVSLLALRQENEALRQRLQELQSAAQRAVELDLMNKRLEDLLMFRDSFGGSAIAAQVVGRSPLGWVHTIILDKGKRDGLREGMAVLVPEGVVGRVVSVSPHAARVLLVSDHSSGVDALVQRKRVHGIAEGILEGRCVLKYVHLADDVQVGDAVVTSGLDGIFPKGQLIGEVVRVKRSANRLFQEVEVAPSVELTKVEEVLVVPRFTFRADGGGNR